MTDITVLVVEDNMFIRAATIAALEDEDFKIYAADTAAAALEILHGHAAIDCLVTDVDLGDGMDGLGLASSVHGKWPEIGIIVVSGTSRTMPPDLPQALFFSKPCDLVQVARTIRELVITYL